MALPLECSTTYRVSIIGRFRCRSKRPLRLCWPNFEQKVIALALEKLEDWKKYDAKKAMPAPRRSAEE